MWLQIRAECARTIIENQRPPLQIAGKICPAIRHNAPHSFLLYPLPGMGGGLRGHRMRPSYSVNAATAHVKGPATQAGKIIAAARTPPPKLLTMLFRHMIQSHPKKPASGHKAAYSIASSFPSLVYGLFGAEEGGSEGVRRCCGDQIAPAAPHFQI